MSDVLGWVPPGDLVAMLVFAVLAIVAIVSAIAVIMSSDPFISALALILTFVSLGTTYLLLSAPFVAVAQVLVYAGAVVVLFLFVIAYLGDRRELPHAGASGARWIRPASLVTLVVVLVTLGVVITQAGYPELASIEDPADSVFAFGSPQAIGEVFLTRYLLQFEVTSLVLLVAAIGGIVLGLAGRGRHDRLRKLSRTRSADEQRRWYADRERSRRAVAAGGRPDVPSTAHADAAAEAESPGAADSIAGLPPTEGTNR